MAVSEMIVVILRMETSLVICVENVPPDKDGLFACITVI